MMALLWRWGARDRPELCWRGLIVLVLLMGVIGSINTALSPLHNVANANSFWALAVKNGPGVMGEDGIKSPYGILKMSQFVIHTCFPVSMQRPCSRVCRSIPFHRLSGSKHLRISNLPVCRSISVRHQVKETSRFTCLLGRLAALSRIFHLIFLILPLDGLDGVGHLA